MDRIRMSDSTQRLIPATGFEHLKPGSIARVGQFHMGEPFVCTIMATQRRSIPSPNAWSPTEENLLIPTCAVADSRGIPKAAEI